MTVALLDADIIAFRAAAAASSEIDWGDGEVTVEVSLEEAIASATHMINDWTTKAWADRCFLCFTSYPTFRSIIYPRYKSNRGPEKPQVYWDLVDHLSTTYPTFKRPNLEADDLLGILATNGKCKDPVIVSQDKDLRTIPGTVLNPFKDEEPIEVTPEEADRFWFFQTLTGDAVDFYPGCPGVGPKGAEDFLASPYVLTPQVRTITRGKNKGTDLTTWVKEPTDDLWSGIVSLFQSRGLTAEDALMQARMARILRASDYNPDTQAIRLWAPNPDKAEVLRCP